MPISCYALLICFNSVVYFSFKCFNLFSVLSRNMNLNRIQIECVSGQEYDSWLSIAIEKNSMAFKIFHSFENNLQMPNNGSN